MRKMLMPIAAGVSITFGCVSGSSDSPAAAGGVTVFSEKTAIRECAVIGFINTETLSLHPIDDFRNQVKALGGDTLFMPVPFLKIQEPGPGPTTPLAYMCDRERIATLHDRARLLDAVRLTNRQDVVVACKFIKNASARSELDARVQTVDLGGDVFYVLSDTSRTAEEKVSGSKTTYNYEVRRLTGEVYRCATKPAP